MHNVGRSAGLREHFGVDNGADPQIYLFKILPRNRFHTALPAMMPHWVTSLQIAMMTWNPPRADAAEAGEKKRCITEMGRKGLVQMVAPQMTQGLCAIAEWARDGRFQADIFKARATLNVRLKTVIPRGCI